VSNKTKFMPTT